jgi:hypothetical protein
LTRSHQIPHPAAVSFKASQNIRLVEIGRWILRVKFDCNGAALSRVRCCCLPWWIERSTHHTTQKICLSPLCSTVQLLIISSVAVQFSAARLTDDVDACLALRAGRTSRKVLVTTWVRLACISRISNICLEAGVLTTIVGGQISGDGGWHSKPSGRHRWPDQLRRNSRQRGSP